MSGEPSTPEEVAQRFDQLRQELSGLSAKINEIEAEAQEHELVIKTLQPMEGERKCFRMIGSVLVERNVAEVLPAVQNNHSQLQKLCDTLQEQRKSKEEALQEFQKKYNVRFMSREEMEQEQQRAAVKSGEGNGKGASAQGVLVSKT